MQHETSNSPAGRKLTASLSIVIPTYTEAARIDSTSESIVSWLATQPYDAELIIVNDGSTDDTLALARRPQERHPEVRVIDIPHAGKAAAVRKGVAASTNDLILFTDADLATPIEFVDQFREAIDAGHDVVIGSREGVGAKRIGEPAMRHFMGRVFNGLVRLMLLPGIQDTQCGFKMFTREAAVDLFGASRLYADDNAQTSGARVTAFDVELLLIARRRSYGLKIIPVTWTFGENSKVNPISDTLNNLSDVLKVKVNDIRGLYD